MTVAKELERIIGHTDMNPQTKAVVLHLVDCIKYREMGYKIEISNLKHLLNEYQDQEEFKEEVL